MKELLDKLNGTINSYHITLEDLVQNIRESNYNSVLYKKNANGFNVITECNLNEQDVATFNYYFTLNELLETVTMTVNGNENIYYSRQEQIDLIRTEISKVIKSETMAV